MSHHEDGLLAELRQSPVRYVDYSVGSASPSLGPDRSADGTLSARAVAAWDAVVRHLGLTPAAGIGVAWVTSDPAPLCLEVEPVDGARVRLHATVPAPDGLMLLPRGHALATAGRLFTGDPAFDDAVVVFADDPRWLGALDDDTRRDIVALARVGAAAAAGAVRLPPSALAAEPNAVLPLLDALRRVASRLALSPEARLDAIVELARHDREPLVRAALKARFASDPEVARRTREAAPPSPTDTASLLARLADPWLDDAAARTLATGLLARPDLAARASELSRLAAGALPALASALADALRTRRLDPRVGLVCVAHLDHHPAMSAELRVALFDALGRTRAPELAPWLAAACETRPDIVADAALAALMRLDRSGEERAALVHQGSRERLRDRAVALLACDPRLGGALVEALALLAPPSSAAGWVALLGALTATRDPTLADFAAAQLRASEPSVRRAAIQAVGALGEAEHVARLAPLAEGLFRDGAEKALARDAVQAIQARLGRERQGGLTLAGADARGGLGEARGPHPQR